MSTSRGLKRRVVREVVSLAQPAPHPDIPRRELVTNIAKDAILVFVVIGVGISLHMGIEAAWPRYRENVGRIWLADALEWLFDGGSFLSALAYVIADVRKAFLVSSIGYKRLRQELVKQAHLEEGEI